MTQRRKILWQLYLYFLVISLLTALAVLFASLHRAGEADAPLSPLDHLGWVTGIAVLSAAAAYLGVFKIQKTLGNIRDGARRFASGDLSFRIEEPRSEELGGLAETLNRMAAQLEERIDTIDQQRIEQEAILSSMCEGVIACDNRLRILQMNKAAKMLVAPGVPEPVGRSIHEIIRNRELHQLIETSVRDQKPRELDTTVNTAGSARSLQVRCTPLKPYGRASIGALIVLNDITSLRRLEGIRRDFVANVSHELRTPLTSIKGFAETLLDGPMSADEDARKFCGIICKQADRLQAIIEDLLSLSNIEQETEEGSVHFKDSPLRDILESALHCVEHQAAEKNIRLRLECDPGIRARVNPALIEQVAVNLIDNAIKYSGPETEVQITVSADDRNLRLSVRDQGSGIPAADRERIFERFYRVDKARSRKAGGTGLGLAIVKHIVGCHNGSIAVDSEMGRGSTFTVSLPRT